MEGPAASLYAKQMERRAAKESLFLAVSSSFHFIISIRFSSSAATHFIAIQ
jgi:hypothetical protein